MSAFFPGPSHALLAPRVAELTWVVQPICRISDVAQSYGIGREGWATAVVTSCNKLLENDRKLEEYTTGLTAWRAASWPRMLLITLCLAAIGIPLARRVFEPVFKARAENIVFALGLATLLNCRATIGTQGCS